LFDYPQAALFVDGLLLIGNTGYDANTWRAGSIAVVQPETGIVIHRYPTSRLNPQRLLRTDDAVYVINTGTYDFSSFEQPRSATPGSVDRIERSQLSDPMAAITSHPLEGNDQFVAPIDAAYLDDGLLVTSGLEPKVLILTGEEPSTMVLELPTGHPTSLGTVRAWRGGFVVVDFNTDTGFLLGRDGTAQCAMDLGESKDEMEGAWAPVVHGDDLYVVLALSGVVRRVSLAGSAPCDNPVETLIAPLGQIPNDLDLVGDALWVTHSGDNNLVQYDLRSGAETRRWVLPVGSNPWEAAFSDDGRWIAITEWGKHAVTLIDRRDNTMRRIFSRD